MWGRDHFWNPHCSSKTHPRHPMHSVPNLQDSSKRRTFHAKPAKPLPTPRLRLCTTSQNHFPAPSRPNPKPAQTAPPTLYEPPRPPQVPYTYTRAVLDRAAPPMGCGSPPPHPDTHTHTHSARPVRPRFPILGVGGALARPLPPAHCSATRPLQPPNPPKPRAVSLTRTTILKKQ